MTVTDEDLRGSSKLWEDNYNGIRQLLRKLFGRLPLCKSTFDMWDPHKDQVDGIQDQHFPEKIKDRDSKLG